MRLFLFTTLLWSSSLLAQAPSPASCLPDWTSLQSIQDIDVKQSSRLKSFLSSQNASGKFQTKVIFESDYSALSGQLTLTLQFDPDFTGVSLPYNLYSVLVVAGGQVLAWEDFTEQCNGPGNGFYPGRLVTLPTIKINQPVGEKEKLQILVWGRL
jgi:hypothetical protein